MLNSNLLKKIPNLQALSKQNTTWKKALIIEDDIAICTVIDSVLEEIAPGIEIQWFSNAEDALQVIYGTKKFRGSHDAFDVVIADIFLEGEATGFDVWQSCVRHFPNAEVIVTSGMPREKYIKIVCDGTHVIPPPFLAKPFSVEECKEYLEDLMLNK